MRTTLSTRITRFRLMAEEVRAAAGGMTHRESQRALTSIADNYELLADQLEQVAAREHTKAASG
jgi:hypothetical protein